MKLAGAVALLWTAALIPLAFLVPVYRGEARSSDGATTHASATLVGENGLWAAGLLCLPLGLALLACLGLRYRRLAVARAAAGVLMVVALVGAASIGLYLLPPAALLVAAATTAR